MVQLLVTDTTGAQNGPFRLNLNQRCKPVHAKPKPKPKKKKKGGKPKGKSRK
jgi:hypothetical protein